MDLSNWIIWAIVLILQQFGHGLSSRGKNSQSYVYNALAGVLSNGIWIISNFFIVANVMHALKEGDWLYRVWVVFFYTLFAVIGSVLSQWVAIRWIEKRFQTSKSND